MPNPSPAQKAVERSASSIDFRCTSAEPSASPEKIGISPAKTSTIPATP